MGVVYGAYDSKRHRTVALKTLQHINPAALQRFKREFRSLADLRHPNLITLYELLVESGRWCFTMELLDGATLADYINAAASDDPSARQYRIRRAFGHLTAGLVALHQAQTLHFDLKPSNVIVAVDDRVVLVDFGLAAELDANGGYESIGSFLVGTVDYMSPE